MGFADWIFLSLILSVVAWFFGLFVSSVFGDSIKSWYRKHTTKPATLDDLAKMVRRATARERVAEMPADLFVAPKLRLSSLDRPITPLEPALIDHQQFLVELGRRQAMNAFNQSALGRTLQL